MKIAFSAEFRHAAANAVVRLNRQSDGYTYCLKKDAIEVVGERLEANSESVRAAIYQALYQEKVYQDTLRIRERIFNG